MTKEFRDSARGGRRSAATRPRALTVFLARTVLFWERLWPAALPIVAPAFVIVIASLFGLWRIAPGWAHWGALLAALAATGFALFRYGREIVWPRRLEALQRLERDGGLRHAPLQALEDRPFDAGAEGSPLWLAHLADMRRLAAKARLKGPRPNIDARDPFALRYAAPGLLALALVVAGSERGARFAEAWNPGAAQFGGVAIADLWIEPPAYTGKAPIYLLRAGDQLAGLRKQTDAPEGSLVVAQVNARRFELALKTPAESLKAASDASAKGRSTMTLAESGVLRLRIMGVEGRWPIGVLPDSSPTARFLEPPSITDDARLAISADVDDDYGVASAALTMRLDPDQERPLDAPALDETAVREQRVVTIEGLAGKSGERRADIDLQSDPWAGLVVIGKLIVKDGAGQTGETEEATFRLPARPFFNPLAKAVIEQRQTLAVAPRDWRRAGRSFDALTLAPEFFYDRSTDYLLMRTAFRKVMRQDGEGFGEAVTEFWPLALQLEDEALELARQKLEAAQDALRQALENGASDEEISRLVEQLREAMQQYLQALAESGQRMAEEGGDPGEMVNEGDLDQLLDSIRDLSQSGAQNAARQALSDLENILNNLRLSSRGQGGQGQGQGQGQGGAAGKAGDLIGRQRDLSNRSFERGQSPGATGDDLAGEESGIASDLSKLLEDLKGGGAADENGEGAKALGEALQHMRDAEDALEGDNFDAAGTSMEEAIASLREGAQSLAESQGKQARKGGPEGQMGPAVDPLGRPIGEAYGQGVDVPEQSDAQRARDVLEELRRRLSDGKRGDDEVDYLERLLERF